MRGVCRKVQYSADVASIDPGAQTKWKASGRERHEVYTRSMFISWGSLVVVVSIVISPLRVKHTHYFCGIPNQFDGWKGRFFFFFLLLFKRLYLPVEFMPTTDESRIIYERAAPLPLQGRMEPSSVFVEPIDICSLILSDRRHVVGWSVLAGLMDPVVPLWRKKKKKTLEDWNLQSFNCCGRAGTESTRWRVDEFVSSLIAFLHWISEQTWNKRHHKNHLQRLYGTNPACLTALARLTLFLFFYSHQSEPYKIKSCERWETERTCNELRMV